MRKTLETIGMEMRTRNREFECNIYSVWDGEPLGFGGGQPLST